MARYVLMADLFWKSDVLRAGKVIDDLHYDVFQLERAGAVLRPVDSSATDFSSRVQKTVDRGGNVKIDPGAPLFDATDWASHDSIGASGGAEPPAISRLELTTSTPPSSVLAQLAAQALVSAVSVFVEVAFDDPAAVLRLGTSANPEAFLPAIDSALSRVGQYTSDGLVRVPAADLLVLALSIGNSTIGRAVLSYEIG